jgi:hypothetical protein
LGRKARSSPKKKLKRIPIVKFPVKKEQEIKIKIAA